MKLTDFARVYKVSERHARRLFTENQADIAGHYERNGRQGTELDDFAVEYLASKLQKPADTPLLPGATRDQEYIGKYVDLTIKYAELAQASNELYKELSKTKDQLAESNKTVALLEAAKEQQAELQGRVERAEEERRQMELTLEGMRREAQYRADEAQRLDEERARAEAKSAELQAKLEAEIQRNRDLQNAPLWKRIFGWKK